MASPHFESAGKFSPTFYLEEEYLNIFDKQHNTNTGYTYLPTYAHVYSKQVQEEMSYILYPVKFDLLTPSLSI